ncbi:MAG: hypothetical protein IPG45_07295 [Deltaproteobacteria bacterium]|jgi:hypothetical protein|nr:hypothetical protein [Deltaproteobacteria bacterium]
MGLLRALEFGLYGGAADRVMSPFNMGMGAGGPLGFLAGLFQPEAHDMNVASQRGPFGGFLDRIFPPSADGQASPLRGVLTAAAVFLGATLFSGSGFGFPGFGLGIPALMPYGHGPSVLEYAPHLVNPWGWQGINL